MDSSTRYHPVMKLKQQEKCELTYLAFYPASSQGANYTDGIHNHWQMSFRGNVAWCGLHPTMKGQLARSTPQSIINQGTAVIVNKPDLISVLDWRRSQPGQCEAILLAGLCGKCAWWSWSSTLLLHTVVLLGIYFWVASSCHSYNKTFHWSCFPWRIKWMPGPVETTCIFFLVGP